MGRRWMRRLKQAEHRYHTAYRALRDEEGCLVAAGRRAPLLPREELNLRRLESTATVEGQDMLTLRRAVLCQIDAELFNRD